MAQEETPTFDGKGQRYPVIFLVSKTNALISRILWVTGPQMPDSSIVRSSRALAEAAGSEDQRLSSFGIAFCGDPGT